MSTEEEVKKEYSDAGVDLPEIKEEPKAEKPEEAAPEAPKEEPKEEPPAPTNDNKPKEEEPPRKRTIYDDYKEKKSELKTEKELREQVEKERDELAEKLRIASEATGRATTTAEKDAIAYAQEVGADPDLVKRIIADARKGLELPTDENLKKDIEEFKAWKTQNSQIIEKQAFEAEFEKVVPSIKELFTNATDDEVASIKKELDTISHTKEWHDKSLDYVLFKNKDALGALVSPKKAGIERKAKKDVEIDTFEFDPNADLSQLSGPELEKWEAGYAKLMKNDRLATDDKGRKIFI